MADKKLKSAFKEAAELAAGVPEEMREIAFNRALDMLLGGEKPGARMGFAAADDELQAKRSSEKVLDQSLRVLNLATGVVGMEALSANQIAQVLQARFGVRTDGMVVGAALDSADFVVDRVMSGSDVLYRLVNPARLLRRKKKPVGDAHAKKHATRDGRKQPKAEAPAPSAVEIVNDLVAKGFFNTARTVRDVLVYLERKGLQFTATQLYPVMMRLIKAGLLAREKSSGGEYEYRAS